MKEAKACCRGRAWACENSSLECRVAVKILLLRKQVEFVNKAIDERKVVLK